MAVEPRLKWTNVKILDDVDYEVVPDTPGGTMSCCDHHTAIFDVDQSRWQGKVAAVLKRTETIPEKLPW